MLKAFLPKGKFVTQKSDATCKFFSISFHGFARVWYYNLKLNSILGLHNLYVEVASHREYLPRDVGGN
jgi:hypothetical protein